MSLTTDRDDACLHEVMSDGQNKCYLVLSQDELSKGFIRPLRHTYKHIVCGEITSMNDRIAATYARNPKFYNKTFCIKCNTHLPVDEFTWYAGFYDDNLGHDPNNRMGYGEMVGS